MHQSTQLAHETPTTAGPGHNESEPQGVPFGPSSPGTHRLLPQHVSLQQAAREEGPSRVRSPRAAEVYLAAKTELAGKGSPIKNKAQPGGSITRGSSPARWGKAAGSLSPIPVLQRTGSSAASPTPTAPSSARDHTNSNSITNRHMDDDGLQQILTSQPAHLHPHPLQAAAVASAFGPASTSPRMLAQINGARSSSATLHPSQPLSGREGSGIESPNRLRLRTISAPGSSQIHTQLHTIALQQATLQSQQQSQLAVSCEMQSPRVARNNSRIPANYAQLNLVVNGSVDAGHCGLASPPGSDGSVVSVYSNPGESPGATHSQAQPSRFRPKPPIAAPGSTSNSASSTPSGGTVGSAVSTISSVNSSAPAGWQPHPPNSCRKGSKPLSAGAVMGPVSECSSPHMQVHGSLPPIGDSRGGDSPAPTEPNSVGSASAFQRRGRSLVHSQASDPSWGGSSSSSSMRPGQNMLRVRGIATGVEGSTPNSPSGLVRTPSSNGGLCSIMARQDSGDHGCFGDLLATGSSSGGGGVSSPYNARGNAGAAVMLGSSGWQHGAFHGSSSSSGGGLMSARDTATPAASPLGISSSSSSSGNGGAAGYPAASSGGSMSFHSKPHSSRGYDMVKKLVAAVRSRNDVQLEAVLSEYRSSGATGLSDRCPTTDRTALHEAVCLGSETMVKLLLAAGSDPNVGHPKEGAPLLQAAAVGALDIVQLLLKHGADIQCSDSHRFTALHHACRSGHVDVAHLLIRRGADLKASTVDGETPLDLASRDARIALCSAAAAATVQEAPSSLQRQLSGALQQGSGSASSSFPGTPSSTREATHVSMFANSSSGGGSSESAAAAAGSAAPGGFSGFAEHSGHHLGTAFTAERSMSSPSILRRISSNGGSSGMRCTSTGGGLLSQVSSATPSAAATPATAPPIGSCGSSPLPAPPLSTSNTNQQYTHPPLSSGSSSAGPTGGSSSGGGTAGASLLSSPNGLPDSCFSAVANMRKPSPPAVSMRESSSGGGRPRSGLISGPPSAEASSVGDSSAKVFKDTPQDDYNRCRTPPPLLNLPKDYQGRKGRFAQQQRQSSSGGSTSKQSSAGLEDTQRYQREDDQTVAQALNYQQSISANPGQHLAAAQAAAQQAAQAMRALTVQEPSWQLAGSPTAAAAALDKWPGLQHVITHGGTVNPNPPLGGPEGSFGSVINSGSAASDTSSLSSNGGGAGRGLSRVSAPPAVGFGSSSSGGGSSSSGGGRMSLDGGRQPESQARQQITGFRMPFGFGSSNSGSNRGQPGQHQQQQQRKPPYEPLQVPAPQQAQQQELQQQQSAPAALPVFRFGIDPNSTMDRVEAKAAAAAAAAAVAARHQGMQGSEGYNPLEHTFKLRGAENAAKHVAVTVQHQQQHDQQQKSSRQQQQQLTSTSVSSVVAVQQQHRQQQQHWPSRPSFERNDTRVPPLLHDQSPIASPRAGSSSSRMTPEVSVIVGYTAAAHQNSSSSQQQHFAADLAVVADAVTTSSEALAMSAARLFEHCSDHMTGDIQWKCGGLLGEGAYGKVWQGLDVRTGNMMAVKELQLVGRRGSEEVNNQLKELKQELEFYKKLNHPNIVGYIDASFKTATNTLYIFLEYVPGGSIADMIKQFGPFPEEMAAKYTRQLLVGLKYLHDQQIVHRDLKGGNVLVTPTGIVKVADFGASKPFGDPAKTDMMKSLRGSAFWMAPEILRGSGYGRKADIWSLGCTVLEMLTGKHPWPDYDNQWAVMLAITQTETGPPRPPGISSSLSDFLDQCFKMDPKERSSTSELLQHPWVLPQPGTGARTRASLSDDV